MIKLTRGPLPENRSHIVTYDYIRVLVVELQVCLFLQQNKLRGGEVFIAGVVCELVEVTAQYFALVVACLYAHTCITFHVRKQKTENSRSLSLSVALLLYYFVLALLVISCLPKCTTKAYCYTYTYRQNSARLLVKLKKKCSAHNAYKQLLCCVMGFPTVSTNYLL